MHNKFLVGKLRLRCGDNIEVNPKEAGCEDGDLIQMAQVRI
jgi:hypothetical protein